MKGVKSKVADYFEFIYPDSEDAYEQIVEENKRAVWLAASKHLKNRNDIEDVVQETFIFSYFYYGKLLDKTKIKQWLCGIARNKSHEFLRNIKPFEEMPDLSDLSTPETIYLELEDKEIVRKAISELPDDIAQTVRLRYFDGKSIDDISQILGIKIGTVKSRLHNARSKLELKLKGEFAMSDNVNNVIKESIKIAKERLHQLEMEGRAENESGNSTDYGLEKLEKAVEYAAQAGIHPSDDSTTLLPFVELSKKKIELAKENKKVVSKLCGSYYYKKSDSLIAPYSGGYTADYNQYADPYEFYTFYSIFGNIYPLFDTNWENRIGLLEKLYTYNNDQYNACSVLVSFFLETVTIGDESYEKCLRILYKRDRLTAGVWYAPDIGIVKFLITTPMEDKITYLLDDYRADGSGYMPLAEGNYWCYKANGENIADTNIYDYINKFTVTHINGDNIAISHLGWICEL
jgi:RNA polymerase sigma factor, sigma-70 family